MEKRQIRQLAEQVISNERYKANFDNLGDRDRFAKEVKAILEQLKAKGTGPWSDFNYNRDYSHYRVTQLLGILETDRFHDMRPNEIVAWAKLLGVEHKDLVFAGAGRRVLPVETVSQLLSEDYKQVIIGLLEAA